MTIAQTPTVSALDNNAIADELTAFVNRHGDANKARYAIVARLKDILKVARNEAEEQLKQDGDGRKCAAALSAFQDTLTKALYDVAISIDDTTQKRTEKEEMAVVATGGYGRGLLAPGSDIDLLFLVPKADPPWLTAVSEYMLYVLWDLGFKVGHATRTIGQCVSLAHADMTICTSLIDSRLILGNGQLFEKMTDRLRSEVLKPNAESFIDAKMLERDERHKRSGDARYLVEPNIKDGKGGLRDLHTLHWLCNAIYGENVGPATVEAGVFTQDEVDTFHRCEDFLWTIRCFLHFMTGRAEERLSFELQPQMAELLGYRSKAEMRAVERFMKHYFLIANDVGDLTRILCSALEMQQIKKTPSLGFSLPKVSWRLRRNIRKTTDFRIENNRLNVADEKAFQRDPINLIRFFAIARKTKSFLHPNALRLIRRSLRLIDDDVRKNPEANSIFLELLTGPGSPATTLRRMNEAGVLGRFILPFRRVVGMMQFNMYHHFTVDEHLIRTVDMLTDIENGGAVSELPLSTKLFSTIKNRRVLYIAALIHDIGKGRKEDHSIVGARIARELCPRFGLTAAETDTVAWLIEEHLTMNHMAQSRDTTDSKTIQDFSEIVKSPERLKLLLLLTVADIRAVGPDVWNGWKGQLLRNLYNETELLLSGGHTQEGNRERVSKAKNSLKHALIAKGWAARDIAGHTGRFYPEYWLRFETQNHLAHCELMSEAAQKEQSVALSHKTDDFRDVTELTIFAINHPRLLSLFAGACAASGANIMGAQITTTRDGYALDTFLLRREFDHDNDEARRVETIEKTVTNLLKGGSNLTTLLKRRRVGQHRVEAFPVEPDATINNALSEKFSVIEVTGRDRPGLLYDLTSTISDLNLDISSAHITTFGEKAVDVFYVTDLIGKKITSESRQEAITSRLKTSLREEFAILSGQS